MEYTKDLIFNVSYSEVKNSEYKLKWTSRLFNKMRRHKIVTTFIFSAMFLIFIDVILMVNFINLIV